MDVGEAEFAAHEAVCEAQMVEAEEVEDRGLEVVDMHLIFEDIEAEIVGFADYLTGFDTAAGEPDGVAVWVVVAAGVVGIFGAAHL